jgi:protein ImuB
MGRVMVGSPRPPRIVSIWIPDWPVVAAGFSPHVAAAVMSANRVVARTPAAAIEGVIIGQRRRQAQGRCPHIELIDVDRARDAREFEPIIRAVAELSPRLDVIEPGWISFAARGPSRYFGGDEALCARLARELGSATCIGAGIGIADGRFASSLAARLAGTGTRRAPVVVESGGSPEFCAPLPIGWLHALGESEPELVDLFVRLGLRRLGDLAALPVGDVFGRFGHPGAHAHRLASGADERPSSTTDPAPERRLDQVLDDPLAQAGAVVFVGKQLADELAGALAAEGRVCTRLVVTLETEHGERSERSWYRSTGLSASAMVERIRWQLDAWINQPSAARAATRTAVHESGQQEITAGITLIRLTPDEVRSDDGEQLGLWGGESDADRRAARAIARLTALTSDSRTSDAGVTVPVWRGGRLPNDRYQWVPAATVELVGPARRLAVSAASGMPWPGSLPAPSPATVLVDPLPIEIVDEQDRLVQVSGRGTVSAPPVRMYALHGDESSGWRRGASSLITAWAGPWPVEERWWEPDHHRRLARFQVLTEDGSGYLVVVERRRWWVSARYD